MVQYEKCRESKLKHKTISSLCGAYKILEIQWIIKFYTVYSRCRKHTAFVVISLYKVFVYCISELHCLLFSAI